MRTATTVQQLADLASLDRKELFRVKVANSTGTLVDFSAYLHSATLTGSVDNMATSGSVSFWREVPGTSLSPLMTSPAPIDTGRRLTLETAVIAKDATVQAGDWVMLFDGTIDDARFGGDDSKLTVPIRDAAALLIDTFIETEIVYGNDDSPIAVETVMQDLLDDTLGSSIVVMSVEGDPDFGVKLYTQQRQPLSQALAALRDLNGWDLRYLWSDAASDFVLTFYEPNRNTASPVHVFGPDDYFTLSDVARTARDIRNVCIIKYSETGTATVVDSASVAVYGRRVIFLDYADDLQITTQAAALALGLAVVGDCSQPPLTHRSENAFFWPVELGDLYTFSANNIHYSSAQDVAVQSWTHNIGPDGNSTTLDCRGSPSGGVMRWYHKETVTRRKIELEDPVQPTLSETLKLVYTTKVGSAGYTLPGTALGSLGGYASTTEVTTDLNGLFREVTDGERLSGITLYRTVAAINTNDFPVPLDWECVRSWLSDIGTGNVEWWIAEDPTGVAAYTGAAKLGGESTNQTTAPDTSPAIDYVQPTSADHADALIFGTVAPGQGFLIHIRQTIAASPEATAQVTGSVLYVKETTPCGA